MQAHDEPELRERVKAELVYQPCPLDLDAQARQMWDEGHSIGDIVILQKRPLSEVAVAIVEGKRHAIPD